MSDLTVSAGLARFLIDYAAGLGADRDALYASSGMTAADLLDQDARVPYPYYVALTKAAKRLSGDEALALRFGAAVHMSEFSVVGLLFHACETILESITQINRYGQLIIEVDLAGPDRFQWVRENGRLWLVDTRLNPNAFPELTEGTFARFISMTRHLWDAPLVSEVQVTHPAPAYAAEYERIYGALTLFGQQANRMCLDESRLVVPIRSQPRYAFGILSERAEALVQELARQGTTRAAVEQLLMRGLHTGRASVEHVASSLGISRQTLYRRLRTEGTTFEDVLDGLRERLALHYLDGGKVTIAEVAFLVGFSDAASFSRAFKRWTGLRPTSARQPGGRGGERIA